ncbi:MAG: hypothetical protein M0006_09115 [Magnetospirillum sp.]|nr:hypothetical protein [Magnetospirillum sp.]
MLDVLVMVSTSEAGPLLPPLAAALGRAGARWGCFLTGDGVRALAGAGVAEALGDAAEAVACEHSWKSAMGDAPCPIEAGSQFHLSAMLGDARRAISL